LITLHAALIRLDLAILISALTFVVPNQGAHCERASVTASSWFRIAKKSIPLKFRDDGRTGAQNSSVKYNRSSSNVKSRISLGRRHVMKRSPPDCCEVTSIGASLTG
jgi:hypothetical protein